MNSTSMYLGGFAAAGVALDCPPWVATGTMSAPRQNAAHTAPTSCRRENVIGPPWGEGSVSRRPDVCKSAWRWCERRGVECSRSCERQPRRLRALAVALSCTREFRGSLWTTDQCRRIPHNPGSPASTRLSRRRGGLGPRGDSDCARLHDRATVDDPEPTSSHYHYFTVVSAAPNLSLAVRRRGSHRPDLTARDQRDEQRA